VEAECALGSSKSHLRNLILFGHEEKQRITKDSLAMAELTTLAAAIYRTYSTILEPDMDGTGPGITSRFEVFHDATILDVKVSFVGRVF
jgi:hypothetical protein